MKVAANALTALTLPSMGEVLALLRKGGMDSHTAFDVLTGSLFDGRVHKTYGGKIVDSRYSPPGMTVPLAVKDLRLALAEAEHMSVPMPATSLVHDRLVATVARGWAALATAGGIGCRPVCDRSGGYPAGSLDNLNVRLRCGASRTPTAFGGSWCGKSQFPQPSGGSTSASHRSASYAAFARSRPQHGRR